LNPERIDGQETETASNLAVRAEPEVSQNRLSRLRSHHVLGLTFNQGFAGDAVGYGFQRFASEPSGPLTTTELPLVCCGAAAGACSGGGGACLTFGGGVLLAGHDGIKSYGSYPK
jgi:hypothetical protein